MSKHFVEINTVYEGSLRCRATHGPSGTQLVTDPPVDNQGKGESFSPTDLVATALGTCMATSMGIYAERHGIDLRGLCDESANSPLKSARRFPATIRTAKLWNAQR